MFFNHNNGIPLHEKLDSFFSYLIAVSVPTIIHFLPLATNVCQFIAAAFGAVIVVTRYIHDRELRKIAKGKIQQ